jgi:hypothetical protein
MRSPAWAFAGATFARTAPALADPDFGDVVIHAYRHRYGLAPGDPGDAGIERQPATTWHPRFRVSSLTFALRRGPA